MAKILYLIDGLPHGGAERQLALLLKYLPPNWENRVISLGDGPYHSILKNQGTSVAVYQRRSRFDLIPVFRLYSEILQYKPGIIHTWGYLSAALAAPICKIFRILLIDGSIRGGNAPDRYQLRTRITFALADHIVANSCAGLLASQTAPDKSSVIYNAIDPRRLELLTKKSNSRKTYTTVIMTGRISAEKDFGLFFEAARRLSAQEPGCWKFVAIGSGEESERKRLFQQAEDLVADGVVELPQAGLEVMPFLEDANIGVLLSVSFSKEGFSNSIMEYMACGLPVICTDSGGNKELVIDGETGYVIPAENVDSFIEKLNLLKNHSDVSFRMGRAGHERLLALCSIERMVLEYVNLYTRLLDKRTQK